MDIHDDKRVLAIVGHFGSGKTEFSVNYALKIANAGYQTALIDLDNSNPFFRSREKQDMLRDNGVMVYSNMYDKDITDEVPAITADIRMPLENTEYRVVTDIGGNGEGAKIIVKLEKYFSKEDFEILVVVNANIPGTSTIKSAMYYIDSIEACTGLKVSGVINNTYLKSETTLNDIMKGYNLCTELAVLRGIPLKYNCCVGNVYDDLYNIAKLQEYPLNIFLMTLQLRDSWHDKNVYSSNKPAGN